MEGIFPLWGRDTLELAHTFIGVGFKSIITCIDNNALGKRFIGRLYDERLLAELPAGIDRCGEHGEFHTFVFDGPLFKEAVAFRKGTIVLRDERFYFCDLLPPD
jgi:diphthamide synthase (EF-2-diphthine--ammonia ligase)